jgi:26S proteasome regulatory subunit N5
LGSRGGGPRSGRHARTDAPPPPHARPLARTKPTNTKKQQQGKLNEALEGLLTLEKQGRVAEDVTASKAACAALLDACRAAGDWRLLEEHVVLLAKRRGQLKQVVQAFVRQAMRFLDDAPSKDAQVSLLKTLQAVTEGKVSGASV